MKRAHIRFYAALNHFLPPERRSRASSCHFYVGGSVKDLIESLGVLCTEVELILANGEPVNFSYRVQDGDRIAVYPPFRSLDISPIPSLRPEPPGEFRFVADAHLGRLAGYLRMLGFDTWYRRDASDEELAAISAGQEHILLTRDRGLLKRNIVKRGYFVQTTDPSRQLVEVLQEFDLIQGMQPFRRCIHCNGILRRFRRKWWSIACCRKPANPTMNSSFVPVAATSIGKALTTGGRGSSSKEWSLRGEREVSNSPRLRRRRLRG